jgi:hypothetical protein
VSIGRVNVAWQNWPGAPGLTQLYMTNTNMQVTVDAMRAFFDAVKALLPSGLTITVPASGDILQEADGTITGTWTVATPPLVVSCTGAGAYAGNAGGVVHWLTSTVVGGRRVRGRSFLVPTIATTFETNGSLTAGAISTINTAAAALYAAATPNFLVWSRPVKAHTEYDPVTGQPTSVAARAGSTAVVNAHRVPDLAISLRSRRI